MKRRTPYNKGQWQVSRERFQLTDYVPPEPTSTVTPLGDLIPDALRNMKLNAHAQVVQIADVWAEIVGPQLASNTRPGHLENRLLTVFVSHPMWFMELRGPAGTEILTRVQEKFGRKIIANIRWSIDPEPPATK